MAAEEVLDAHCHVHPEERPPGGASAAAVGVPEARGPNVHRSLRLLRSPFHGRSRAREVPRLRRHRRRVTSSNGE
jgi:hypothetical protein